MRDEKRFEIERAFDLLPHVVGASWAVIWFRLNGIENPSRNEFYDKVLEYFDLLNPLFDSFQSSSTLQEMSDYINLRRNQEIKNIKEGKNKEIEKRYERYVDYG
jgi:hypothetical protein